MNSLNDAIRRIENCRPDFDYEHVEHYARLVKNYLRQMRDFCVENGQALETPLFDISRDLPIELPVEVHKRLREFVDTYNDYGVTIENVCCWYLRDVYAKELGLTTHQESVYESLIQLLEAGGHFYDHHGELCLSDAASIPYIGR